MVAGGLLANSQALEAPPPQGGAAKLRPPALSLGPLKCALACAGNQVTQVGREARARGAAPGCARPRSAWGPSSAPCPCPELGVGYPWQGKKRLPGATKLRPPALSLGPVKCALSCAETQVTHVKREAHAQRWRQAAPARA